MKTLIKRIFITSLLLALPCAPVLYAGEAKVAKAQKTYPNYTADEIWQRFLTMFAVKEGGLTQNMVEKTWGVKLQAGSGSKNVYTPLFYLKHWESSVEFDWGDGIHAEKPKGFMPPPSGKCIDMSKKRIAEIERLGWVLIEDEPYYPTIFHTYSFRKECSLDKTKVMKLRVDTIEHPGNCLAYVRFGVCSVHK